MKKWLIILLLMLPIVNATICEERIDNGTTCLMVTPEITCDVYNYSIILKNGTSTAPGSSLTLVSGSIYSFNFTNETGDYIVHLCDGSTREFRVTETYDTKFQEEENARMSIAIVVGLGIVIAILLVLSFKLDESHGILKILLQLISVTLLLLIPASLVINNYEVIFYKAMVSFITIFWIYVSIYFIWWLFNKMRKTASQ